MSHDSGVTLQISLAPTDAPHAEQIVPHQLRQWGRQVDEILLVVDMHRSRGRFADKWHERLPRLQQLIERLRQTDSRVRVLETNYADSMMEEVANAYFGGRTVPAKCWMGSPIYPYVFALHAATHRYVLHTDSDMFFGGGSQTWVHEAIEALRDHPEAIACNPLPGPPTSTGELRSQSLERDERDAFTYRSQGLSTRVFFMDRQRLRERIAVIPLVQPPASRRLQAWLEGNSPYVPLEAMFSRAMEATGMVRLDFLGAAPGMWSLHPVWRTPLFYERLPALVAQVEAGEIPAGQRGYHDLNSAMMDWTGATLPRWQRYRTHLNLMLRRFQPA